MQRFIILLATLAADPPQFEVVNKCPPKFVVVNKMQAAPAVAVPRPFRSVNYGFVAGHKCPNPECQLSQFEISSGTKRGVHWHKCSCGAEWFHK